MRSVANNSCLGEAKRNASESEYTVKCTNENEDVTLLSRIAASQQSQDLNIHGTYSTYSEHA